MPTRVTRIDGAGVETTKLGDEEVLKLDLHVSAIRIRHGEVSLFDEQGRESVLIARGSYPGAGMDVNLADHVKLDA